MKVRSVIYQDNAGRSGLIAHPRRGRQNGGAISTMTGISMFDFCSSIQLDLGAGPIHAL